MNDWERERIREEAEAREFVPAKPPLQGLVKGGGTSRSLQMIKQRLYDQTMKSKLLLLLFVLLPTFAPITSSYAPPHPRDVYPEEDYYDDGSFRRYDGSPLDYKKSFEALILLFGTLFGLGWIVKKFGLDWGLKALVLLLVFLYLKTMTSIFD